MSEHPKPPQEMHMADHGNLSGQTSQNVNTQGRIPLPNINTQAHVLPSKDQQAQSASQEVIGALDIDRSKWKALVEEANTDLRKYGNLTGQDFKDLRNANLLKAEKARGQITELDVGKDIVRCLSEENIRYKHEALSLALRGTKPNPNLSIRDIESQLAGQIISTLEGLAKLEPGKYMIYLLGARQALRVTQTVGERKSQVASNDGTNMTESDQPAKTETQSQDPTQALKSNIVSLSPQALDFMIKGAKDKGEKMSVKEKKLLNVLEQRRAELATWETADIETCRRTLDALPALQAELVGKDAYGYSNLELKKQIFEKRLSELQSLMSKRIDKEHYIPVIMPGDGEAHIGYKPDASVTEIDIVKIIKGNTFSRTQTQLNMKIGDFIIESTGQIRQMLPDGTVKDFGSVTDNTSIILDSAAGTVNISNTRDTFNRSSPDFNKLNSLQITGDVYLYEKEPRELPKNVKGIKVVRGLDRYKKGLQIRDVQSAIKQEGLLEKAQVIPPDQVNVAMQKAGAVPLSREQAMDVHNTQIFTPTRVQAALSRVGDQRPTPKEQPIRQKENDQHESLQKIKEFATKETRESRETYLNSLRAAKEKLGAGEGLLDLSKDIPTLILPDIHGRREMLVDILESTSDDGTVIYDLLRTGKINIVCVGDGMHTESKENWSWGDEAASDPDERDRNLKLKNEKMEIEMIRSLGTMKMIMDLIKECPNFRMIRGNHEDIRGGFLKYNAESARVRLWIKETWSEDAGEAFIEEWAEFESFLPLVVRIGDTMISHTATTKPYTEDEIRYRPKVTKIKTNELVDAFTWTDNTTSPNDVEAALPQQLKNLGVKRQIIGHRPVGDGLYRTQGNGQLIQVNNPKKHLVTVINADGSFDPSKQVIDLQSTHTIPI